MNLVRASLLSKPLDYEISNQIALFHVLKIILPILIFGLELVKLGFGLQLHIFVLLDGIETSNQGC